MRGRDVSPRHLAVPIFTCTTSLSNSSPKFMILHAPGALSTASSANPCLHANQESLSPYWTRWATAGQNAALASALSPGKRNVRAVPLLRPISHRRNRRMGVPVGARAGAAKLPDSRAPTPRRGQRYVQGASQGRQKIASYSTPRGAARNHTSRREGEAVEEGRSTTRPF